MLENRCCIPPPPKLPTSLPVLMWSVCESMTSQIPLSHLSRPDQRVNMEKLPRAVRRSLQTNYLLAALVIGFMFLYLHDHAKLQQFQQQPIQQANKIDHKARLHQRSLRVKRICGDFNNSMKLEHNAVYYKEKSANPCTGTHFKLKEKDHFICNVLKGGSTSWEIFFKENKIPITKGRCKKIKGNDSFLLVSDFILT